MTLHSTERARSPRLLVFALMLIAISAVSGPALAQKKVSNGCTAAQIQQPEAKACLDQLDRDLIANRKEPHVLVCGIAGDMRCCTDSGNGRFANCGPRLNVAVFLCSALKAEKGVWTADPKTIKANTDKKTCSQDFTCGPPAQLTADQKRCTPVISSSRKKVAQTGTCVPGSAAGTCSSCLAKQPNDPCVVTFRQ